MLAQFFAPIIGGEESHVRTLSLELAARGHEVAVATLRQEGMMEFEMDGPIRVYRLKGTMQRLEQLFIESGRRHAPPFPDPETVWGLRQVLAAERPQIVHAHNWMIYSFLPLKVLSRAKLVLTLHDYSIICAQKRLMYLDTSRCSGPGSLKCLKCSAHHYGPAKGIPTVLLNWAMNLPARAAVDMFIAVSNAVAEKTGLAGSNLPYQIIPNFLTKETAVSTEDFTAYLDQLPGKDFLLFVGDLSRDKGVDVLLKAYAVITGAPPLVLIGRKCADTPEQFPPNVFVFNSWPRGAVLQTWHRSMVGFLPSTCYETFGIVVIEAMAAGKPMIASRIGGIPDIVIEGETGFLIPPGDEVALTGAIQRLLDNSGLREQMGIAAQKRSAIFQADTVVPGIEQIYRQLIED